MIFTKISRFFNENVRIAIFHHKFSFLCIFIWKTIIFQKIKTIRFLLGSSPKFRSSYGPDYTPLITILLNIPFKVDCMPYRSNEHVREHIASAFLLHHSNFPESSFTVGVTPEFAPVSRLISDQGFDLILGKFSSILSPDPAGFFEVTGTEYYLKDFRVRVGTAAMNSVTKVRNFWTQKY